MTFELTACFAWCCTFS